MTVLAARIEANSMPVTECGCWIWMKKIERRGYGHIDVNGKTRAAHRMSWTAFRGPIPDGLLVCHTCDIRCCVNPDHLFLGTAKQNTADMFAKGRNPNLRGNNAKITPDQVIEIRSSTAPQADLAQRFGVHPSSISFIRSGRNWKHV